MGLWLWLGLDLGFEFRVSDRFCG